MNTNINELKKRADKRKEELPYVKSIPDLIIENFKTRLNNLGVTTTVRASRGEDILAACGMLAGEHK